MEAELNLLPPKLEDALSPCEVRPGTVRLVLILGMLTAFGSMAIDMYLPAFSAIADDLHVQEGLVQYTLAAFLIGVALGQTIYGPLADRFGRRRPLLVGCGIFMVAAIGCAMAHSITTLVFWRFVMALGGASGMVISRAVVRDLYNESESAKMYSLLMLVMGVAPILAPLLGGQLLAFASWRAIFGVLALFGLVCMLAVAFGLPETCPAAKRKQQGWADVAPVYGKLLRHQHLLRYGIVCGCAAGVNFAYISGAPFVYMELHHVDPQHFGFFFGMNSVGLIGASQLNRWLLRKYTPEQVLSCATLITALFSTLLLLSAATGMGGFPAIVGLVFVCIGSLGFVFPNCAAAAMEPFAPVAGSASSMLGMLQWTIGGLSGALVGLLHNGTAIPMAAVLAACGMTSFAILKIRPQSLR